MSKYRLVGAVSAIACLILLTVAYRPDKPVPQKANQEKITTTSSTASSAQSHSSQASIASTITPVAKELPPEVIARLYALKPAHDAWRRSRGYGEEDLDGTPKDYAHYSDEQLRQLMAQGDMFAIQALATREMEKKGNRIQILDNAKALWLQAATLGSMYAVNQLARINGELLVLNAKKDPDAARQYKLDADAWHLVGGIRNELLGMWLREKMMPESMRVDETEAKQRAQVFYDELVKQRRAQNLPDFDNSPSEFEQVMLAEYERQLASGEGKKL